MRRIPNGKRLSFFKASFRGLDQISSNVQKSVKDTALDILKLKAVTLFVDKYEFISKTLCEVE